MDGSVHLREEKNRGNRIFINLNLQVVSHEDRRFGAEQKFQGKQALLVDLPESNAHALAAEINTWGMATQIANGREEALTKLKSSSQPIDLVLIYTRLGNMNGMALSAEIAIKPELATLKQILVMSTLQSDTPEMKNHLRVYPQVCVIEKPIIRKRLYDVAMQRLLSPQPMPEDERSAAERESQASAIIHRVLLVEDHRVDQMVISAMLKKMGCYVQLAKNGLEAVEIIAKERFDLVLMDYDMKEQESIIATQKIRESEREIHSLRHLPIIAVTASQIDSDESSYLDAGMDDYIAKPIRYDDLDNRLQRWLAKT
jgi:CheY-like chemotaxis protein